MNAFFIRQAIPDNGFANSQRIGDPNIGLTSLQQQEDILLICDKKSEIVSLLSVWWKKCNGRGKDLPLSFSNSFQLRFGSFSSLVRIPSQEIVFRDGWSVVPQAPVSTSASRGKKNRPIKYSPYSDTFGLQIEHDPVSKKITIHSEPGLPHNIVDERNKRRQMRQREAEARRRREEAARQQRAAAKAAVRENERQQLLAEKKYDL